MFAQFRSLKLMLMGIVATAILVGPFGVNAGALAPQLTAIQEDILTIESIIANSTTLTSAGRFLLSQAITQLEDHIALLAALDAGRPTAELVYTRNPDFVQMQIVTSNGVRTLDFSFNALTLSLEPRTDQELINEAVQRAADTLNLNEDTLRAGLVVVPAFTGIKQVVLVPTATDTVVAPPSTTYNPDGRTKVQNIVAIGSVPDFDMVVQVGFGPETVGGVKLDAATITRKYTSFTKKFKSVSENMDDLVEKTMDAVTLDFGIPKSVFLEKSTISIERFRDEQEIEDTYGVSSFFGITTLVPGSVQSIDPDLAGYMGMYSIIEKIELVVGDPNSEDILGDPPFNEGFVLKVTTDQDETLLFRAGCDIDDGLCQLVSSGSKYQYSLKYKIHGVTLDAMSEVTNDTTAKEEMEEILEGLGGLFGVTDEVMIGSLVNFAVNNGVYYHNEVREISAAGVSLPDDYTQAKVCTADWDREREILAKITEFIFPEAQFAAPPLELITIDSHSKNVTVPNDATTQDECRGYSVLGNFFSIPYP